MATWLGNPKLLRVVLAAFVLGVVAGFMAGLIVWSNVKTCSFCKLVHVLTGFITPLLQQFSRSLSFSLPSLFVGYQFGEWTILHDSQVRDIEEYMVGLVSGLFVVGLVQVAYVKKRG